METALLALAVLAVVACGVFAWDMRTFAAIADGVERLMRKSRGRGVEQEAHSRVATWSDHKTTVVALTVGAIAALVIVVAYFLAMGNLLGSN